jgi:hypothetical protein
LLIALPNVDDPPSGNHEPLKSEIPKRKKAKLNAPLSCKIQHDLNANSAYFLADPHPSQKTIKADEIAIRQLVIPNEYLGRRERPLRVIDVKEMFQMRDER